MAGKKAHRRASAIGGSPPTMTGQCDGPGFAGKQTAFAGVDATDGPPPAESRDDCGGLGLCPDCGTELWPDTACTFCPRCGYGETYSSLLLRRRKTREEKKE
jgi:hypothetical protein